MKRLTLRLFETISTPCFQRLRSDSAFDGYEMKRLPDTNKEIE